MHSTLRYLAFFLAMFSSGVVRSATQVVAVLGDTAPDGNGRLDAFEGISPINSSGDVAFRASLVGTIGGAADDAGVFRGSVAAGLTQIARKGEGLVDGNGLFSSFERLPIHLRNGSSLLLNDAGQVAFLARAVGTSGGELDDEGLFLGDGLAAPRLILREGQPAPDGNGVATRLTTSSSSYLVSPPSLGVEGQIAFGVAWELTESGTAQDWGVYRRDEGGGRTEIVRRGNAAPDGTVFNFNFLPAPSLNSIGEVAFRTLSTDTTTGAILDGVFLGDGANGIIQVARKGQSAPDGNGTIGGFGRVELNDAGQCAFRVFFGGTAGGSADDTGIFVSDASGELIQIAREGQPEPEGLGHLGGFDTGATFELNNSGEVLFETWVTDPVGPPRDILLRGDRSTALTEIVREGQLAPDGNGTFNEFREVGINDAGQVAFKATLANTAGGLADNEGLFFFDDTLGLIQVAREGDAFLGSTILGREILPPPFSLPLAFSFRGLNDSGQVGFTARLEDGRSAIAVWSIPVPEPSPLSMLVLGGVGMFAGRRLTYVNGRGRRCTC